jgi:hypothetical protein
MEVGTNSVEVGLPDRIEGTVEDHMLANQVNKRVGV